MATVKTAKKRPSKKDKAPRAPRVAKPKQMEITDADGKPITQIDGQEEFVKMLTEARDAQDAFKAAQEEMVSARMIVEAEMIKRKIPHFRGAGFDVKLEDKKKLSIKRTNGPDDDEEGGED